ncbi:hypothetical protein JMN32_01825 [Fulvivirga sp. 29W222]|uniref:Uncharacterized protein n=1 Tax=Fulvivirga marina TaxID=2494733 RepID=A0A937FV55_9BACT|nr:hypothetical protein [Fulvivirga marina]MBL6445028.1 hypothetical protein [Fulvivirga marina]
MKNNFKTLISRSLLVLTFLGFSSIFVGCSDSNEEELFNENIQLNDAKDNNGGSTNDPEIIWPS